MTGSTKKRDPHGGADPYSKLSHAQERRKMTYPLVIVGTVVVVAICALVAFLVTRSDDDSSSTAASGTGAAAAADAKQQTADVTVSGEPLPQMPETSGSAFTDAASDTAIGRSAPKIEGESFDGSKISIDPADGTPRVFVFVAHWCPHCQAEVPLIQEWIDAGNLPDNVEIVFVSTAVTPARGNYPVSDWIVKEGVTPKVILDDDSSGAASKFGLTGFPYFVMTNGEGKVVARGSGEVPIETFGAAVDALAAGQDPNTAS